MKLAGLRVLDLSRFLPGPYLTGLLSDHGADVIGIEPPGEGEPTRHIGPRCGAESVWFRNTHRGKQCLELDLKDPAGVARFMELAVQADVIVEGFRPGVVDRLGIGYAAVSRINPGVVYASITSFGQTGPDALKPAHDAAIEAQAGVLSLNIDDTGKPVLPHIPVADISGALMGLAGVLMALHRRNATGRGDYIDISMHDCVIASLPHSVGPVFAHGRPPDPKQERSWGGHSFNHVYGTRDGRHIVLCGMEEKFIRNLLDGLERPDLVDTALAPPGAAHEPVKAFLAKTFATRPRDAWIEWFKGRDIGFAPVLDLDEALKQPQAIARAMVVRDADGFPQLGNPIRFAQEPAVIDTVVPERGCTTAVFGARRHSRD